MSTIDMALHPAYPVKVIYDTAAAEPLHGTDDNTSLIVKAPFALQLGIIPAGTTVVVEKCVIPEAGWLVDTTIVGAGAGALVTFPVRLNFVRVRRSVGAGAVLVYAQGA
jgi:hypothetical protein